MPLVSIFNDVIGPVMRGPSSSHCAAALRIGRIARDLVGGTPEEVLVEFDRDGSLPTTHESQGSDMGLCGGLLGWDCTAAALPESPAALAAAGCRLRFATVDVGDPHPNTYRLALSRGGRAHTLRAVSTGGGMIDVVDIDGFTLSLAGDAHETLVGPCGRDAAEQLHDRLADDASLDGVRLHQRDNTGWLVHATGPAFIDDDTLAPWWRAGDMAGVRRLGPVLPVTSRRASRVPFSTAAGILAADAGRGLPLWRHAIDYECLRGPLAEERVLVMMTDIVTILKRSIAEGIAGTSHADRILGHQSGEFARHLAAGRLLDGGALDRAVLYVTALMEVKSALGVIVAMPTAGACAALPGVVIAVAEARNAGDEAIARALLAAGLVGVCIASAWTFAAEVGGCQAEGGAAAAMASAALVTLAGGPTDRALAAASMALQSMIGLICDPIANRVEAPCLGKNVMAAANALACANMALAGFDQVIPFDEVIETARRVAGQMPREVRCTALGGLSITPTSLAIQARLEAARGTCGGGCGCR
ncbi:MAG: L-serine ammonia-lyase, iron-sulfur-dependent, subunit alpha [Planctomycetaceae bacterium]